MKIKDKPFWLVTVAGLVSFGLYWQLGHPVFKTERLLMFALIFTVIGTLIFFIRKARRGEPIFLRSIPGLKRVEEAVGRSTEMGSPILYVPGISDMDQVETVASVIVLGHVASLTAQYETSLEVPVSRSIVMKAAREVCKESYLMEGKPEGYNDDMVHYLADEQFAYAAGVNGIMLRERPAACMYMGKFYAESLIFAETGNAIDAIQIAGTASQTQIPFFVTACDYTLIGEEFFAASAYLSRKPELTGGLKGQDWLKALVVGGIVICTFLRVGFDLGWYDFNILEFLTVG